MICNKKPEATSDLQSFLEALEKRWDAKNIRVFGRQIASTGYAWNQELEKFRVAPICNEQLTTGPILAVTDQILLDQNKRYPNLPVIPDPLNPIRPSFKKIVELHFFLGTSKEIISEDLKKVTELLQKCTKQGTPAVFLFPFAPKGNLSEKICLWVAEDYFKITMEEEELEKALISKPRLECAQAAKLAKIIKESQLPDPQIFKGMQFVKEKEYSGDCYLANYAFTYHLPNDKLSQVNWQWFIWRALQQKSRFFCWAHSANGKHGVCLSSPERFVLSLPDLESSHKPHSHLDFRIFAEPIKGTQKIDGEISLSDLQKLWNSEKEFAEQILVTDLMRNDLNQICKPGTVTVTDPFFLRKTPTMLQMQTTIFGNVSGSKIGDMFGKMLPAASVSGTPKKRVLEILRQAEITERGYYTGVSGMILPDGSVDSAVNIRSLFASPRGLHFGVGAGITSLSETHKELEELQTKKKSIEKFWNAAEQD